MKKNDHMIKIRIGHKLKKMQIIMFLLLKKLRLNKSNAFSVWKKDIMPLNVLKRKTLILKEQDIQLRLHLLPLMKKKPYLLKKRFNHLQLIY